MANHLHQSNCRNVITIRFVIVKQNTQLNVNWNVIRYYFDARSEIIFPLLIILFKVYKSETYSTYI